MCNTLWRFRFPLCENSFPQTSQLKGFSPVWHRRCRARIAGETQIFRQMSHLSGVFDLNSSGIFSKLSGFISETKNMNVRKAKDILITLCILMVFPIHTDTISMGLPIVHFRGSLVEFSKVWCISVPEGCFNLNHLHHISTFWRLWNIMYLKILWKMEHLLFWSKCSIFHNLFKSIQNLT